MALKAQPSRLSGSMPGRLKPALGSGPERDKNRRAVIAWRAWYGTQAWRDLSLKVKIEARFTCEWPGCGRVSGRSGEMVTDHKVPHRGDEALFWERANLQCLCKACHDRHKQAQERRGGVNL